MSYPKKWLEKLARGLSTALVHGASVTNGEASAAERLERMVLEGCVGFQNKSEAELREELAIYEDDLDYVADFAALDPYELEEFLAGDDDDDIEDDEISESASLLCQLLQKRQKGITVGATKVGAKNVLVVYSERRLVDAPTVFDGYPVVVKVVGKVSATDL